MRGAVSLKVQSEPTVTGYNPRTDLKQKDNPGGGERVDSTFLLHGYQNALEQGTEPSTAPS